jgi:hypothetical protein
MHDAIVGSDHDAITRAWSGRDTEHLESHGPFLERRSELCLEERLAVARCLPDLGEVVPHVLGVDDVRDVGCPRPHWRRVGAHHPVREAGTPVVAHQIDRLVETAQLAGEPLGVGILGGYEPVRQRAAETRELESGRWPVEFCTQRVPQGGGLGHAMDEDDHAGTLDLVVSTTITPAISSRPLQ